MGLFHTGEIQMAVVGILDPVIQVYVYASARACMYIIPTQNVIFACIFVPTQNVIFVVVVIVVSSSP